MKSFRSLLAASFVSALCAFNASNAADWKPDKRVEIVVPNAAGGGNDRIARLAQRIIQEQRLVDSVVTVVNKPGAGVVMGLTYLNQHPDGNSISIISATFLGDAISGRSSMSLTDITPIAQLFTEYVAFAVKTDASIKTGKDLLDRLRADASSVSTAISGGIGNHNYIALALAARSVGAEPKKLKIALFNGGSEAITAALGGHVDLVVAPAASLMPHVASGRLRMIAITSPKRLSGPYAAVPTWKELGANAVVSNWRAMVGPRGMVQPQLSYWENVFARVTSNEEWKHMLERDLLTGEFLDSAETRNQLKSEYAELKIVMTELGLTK